jgi:acyl-CoA thioesterase FadM
MALVKEDDRLADILEQTFELTGEVRDTEIDLAGVLNHVNYLAIMAHARYSHLRQLGIDIHDKIQKGFIPAPTQEKIRYKLPLRAGEEYTVTSKVSVGSGDQLRFEHTMKRQPDGAIAARGSVETTYADQQQQQTATEGQYPQKLKTLADKLFTRPPARKPAVTEELQQSNVVKFPGA